MTDCNRQTLRLQPLGRRTVEAAFTGGRLTSDGGGLLLRELEKKVGVLRDFAGCFTDGREARYVEHPVPQLVAQRVLGLALGYEDLNDHDELRHDPALAMMVGQADVTGQRRARPADRGVPLAGKSTLNRLELSPSTAQDARYHKISHDPAAIERCFVEWFIRQQAAPPARVVLDLDATDDPLHGQQEGRFFHGHYDHYCYLPLYVFAGDFLLASRLLLADRQPAAGAVAVLEPIVRQLRAQWPTVQLVVRGDSGFCREEIMAWCEREDIAVDYVLGLQRNARLERELAPALIQAQTLAQQTRAAARVFTEFAYRTLGSWSRDRRVIGKAEHLDGKDNPRFVVTSLTADVVAPAALYEQQYCGRGDMENRIKEQQLWLFADRTSTYQLQANQLRLYFSSVAYVLLQALRHLALAGTALARAQCGTIRLKLLKLGAQVHVSVRRVWLTFAAACPYQGLLRQVLTKLQALPDQAQ